MYNANSLIQNLKFLLFYFFFFFFFIYLLSFPRVLTSHLSDKIKRNFFQAIAVSIQQYGCTTWMLTNCMEKKLDGNYTSMLGAVLKKSWKQHPTKELLYSHLPSVSQTIQVRWTRHVEQSWRSKVNLISDVLLSYLSTPPLWQVNFYAEFNRFEFRVFLLLD